jgi:hypothetical protein
MSADEGNPTVLRSLAKWRKMALTREGQESDHLAIAVGTISTALIVVICSSAASAYTGRISRSTNWIA